MTTRFTSEGIFLDGRVYVNNDPGVPGQVLTSQGVANAIWSDASGVFSFYIKGDTANTYQVLNSNTVIISGANGIITTLSNNTIHVSVNTGNSTLYVNSSGLYVNTTALNLTSNLSSLLDVALTANQGDVLYYNGSAWTDLPPGTPGQFLQTQGEGANPQWATAAGGSFSFNLAADGGSNDLVNDGETVTYTGANGVFTTVSDNQIQIDTHGANGIFVTADGINVRENEVDHDALLNFVSAEHIDWSVTGAEDVHVDRITSGAVTQHEGDINHNNLLNYDPNRHIDHTSVTFTAGDGLTGGGNIAANRQFDVVAANTTIKIFADSLAVNTSALPTSTNLTSGNGIFIDSDTINIKVGNTQVISNTSGLFVDQTQFEITESQITDLQSYVVDTRQVIAGAGLTGGGDLTADRTFDIVAANSTILVTSDDIAANTEAIKAAINHDSLTGFVADEHVAHSGVDITAGAGLTGGGDISASRTIDIVAANTTILVTADAIAANTEAIKAAINHDSLTGFVADEHVAHSGVDLTAGAGLQGGGAIDASRQFDIVAANSTILVTSDNIAANTEAIKAAINHDTLTGFVADEHVAHSGVDITAGAGLTGGGDISATRTLDVVAANSTILVTADAIAANTEAIKASINHDSLTGFVAEEHIDHSTVTIQSGAGLTGGGTIESTRTLDVGQANGIISDINSIQVRGANGINVTTDGVNVEAGNSTIFVDASGVYVNTDAIPIGAPGDIESVTAGAGLTGGGTSGDVTLDVVAANSTILVTADAIAANTEAIKAAINHDSLTGFVADEHVAHSSIDMIAGDGLSGGGTIDSDRTFNVGSGNGVIVDTNSIQVRAGNTIFVDSSGVNVKANPYLVGNSHFRIPTGSTAARPASVEPGYFRFNLSTQKIEWWDGSAWTSPDTGGGEVNQNAFSIFQADSGADVEADATTDAAVFDGANGIFTTADSGTDTIGINIQVGNTQLISNTTGLFVDEKTLHHDNLIGFVDNEHIDHSTITITAGDGLTGGGTIDGSFSVDVAAANGIISDVNSVQVRGANGILVTTAGVNVKSNDTTIVVDSDGVSIDDSTISITASQISDDIALGTDTSGDYVASFTAGAGLTGDASGEGSTPTIDVVAANSTILVTADAIAANTEAIKAAINHDSLTGFVADEHVAHSGVDLTAGAGLTGGGDISASRTFDVVAANSTILVTADAITANTEAIKAAINHDSLTGFVADEHIAHSGVDMIAGDGLTGGGTIDATRTFNVVGANGIVSDTNSIQALGANGILVTSAGINVKAGNNTVFVDADGVYVNTANILTSSANYIAYANTINAIQKTATAASSITFESNTAVIFQTHVISHGGTDATDQKAWLFKGAIERLTNGDTAFVNTPSKEIIAETSGSTTWDVTLAVNSTANTFLDINVTGDASANVDWYSSSFIYPTDGPLNVAGSILRFAEVGAGGSFTFTIAGDVGGPDTVENSETVTYTGANGMITTISDNQVQFDIVAANTTIKTFAGSLAVNTAALSITTNQVENAFLTYAAEVDTNSTATLNEVLPVNSNTAPRTITTPSSPVSGNRFGVLDSRAKSAINNITVEFSASADNLNGASQDYILNENGASIIFRYLNADIGWVVENI